MKGRYPLLPGLRLAGLLLAWSAGGATGCYTLGFVDTACVDDDTCPTEAPHCNRGICQPDDEFGIDAGLPDGGADPTGADAGADAGP